MFSVGKVYLPLIEQGKDHFVDGEFTLMLITGARWQCHAAWSALQLHS